MAAPVREDRFWSTLGIKRADLAVERRGRTDCSAGASWAA